MLEENAKLLNQYVAVMEKHKTASKTVLHRLTYGRLRSTSKLPSALIQTARDRAVEAFKSFKKRKQRNRKASLPTFNACVPVRLDARVFSVVETDNKFKYFASIASCNGRVFVPLLGQRYQYKYLKKLLGKELEMGTVELVKKDKEFYVYIAVKKEVTVNTPTKSFTPIGVDLGLVNLSTSVILKDSRLEGVRFSSGRKVIAKRNHFTTLRKQLGKAKKLWKIKSSKQKESRYMRDLNHKISSKIIKQALSAENPVIVMENLKHIRQRINASRKMNKHLHNWGFRQLQGFIEYKAAWLGIPTAFVNARYTSQKCSKCDHVEKANRNGRVFKCKRCGYELNADLNAAINIAKSFKGNVVKNFASSYMLDAAGDVATPLTPQASA